MDAEAFVGCRTENGPRARTTGNCFGWSARSSHTWSDPRVSFLCFFLYIHSTRQALGRLNVADLLRRRRRRPSRSIAKPLRLSVAAAPYSSCRMQLPEGSRGERDAPRMSETTGQHLYLIFDDWDWGYSIRKIKLPLRSPHQPSLRPLEQRSLRRLVPCRPVHKRLPPPCICLEAARRDPSFVAAVGTNIIAAQPRNHFSNSPVLECFLPIFDSRSLAVRLGPGLLSAVQPVFIPVSDDKLFALDMYSFKMLSLKPLCPPHEWSWCDLPKPPLKSSDVTSFAVGSDGLTIFASTDAATFTFDTLNTEWKQYSNRSLPFAGPANYVPALDIFVGLSKAPDNYSDLCFCRKLGHDQNVIPGKLIKDPTSHVGATLVYLGGSEPAFCLVECISITKGKSVDKWLEMCNQLKFVDLGGGNYGELDQLKKNVDEGDGVSGSMQECGELDDVDEGDSASMQECGELDDVDEGDSASMQECGELDDVDEGGSASGSMLDRYLYRLTTFSLSFDNNRHLTMGETCVVQCYMVPKEVSQAIALVNPVAFCM